LAGKVKAGLAESNGSLPLGGWLKVTCGLTACTPGSAPGHTLSNEYGRTLPLLWEQSSYSILVPNVTRMSLTCYEEIARVRCVRGCYENASNFISTHMSRWSGVSLTYLQQVVRVVLVEFGERHDKRTNGQHSYF